MHAFPRWFLPVLLSGMMSAGCDRQEAVSEAPAAPLVRVARLQPVEGAQWSASGTVHAQIESPLAFRVPGQIVRREASAGERVEAGQLLMTLDTKDLREQLASAQAQLNSARAEAQNAVAERERTRRLAERRFISPQTFDNARTAADSAVQRVAAAEAQLAQARNAMDYANLRAPAAGVLLEILAEPGQVVGTGQAVAVLAQDGPREAEVFIPQEHRNRVPQQARALVEGGRVTLDAKLRELSASADAVTRTWRARYQLQGESMPELGSIVRLEFAQSGDPAAAAGNLYRVPLGALSERGEGARLWVVAADGKVAPQPVQVLRLDQEEAYVASALPAGTAVVALGTHLLVSGQAVRTSER